MLRSELKYQGIQIKQVVNHLTLNFRKPEQRQLLNTWFKEVSIVHEWNSEVMVHCSLYLIMPPLPDGLKTGELNLKSLNSDNHQIFYGKYLFVLRIPQKDGGYRSEEHT